MNLDLKDKRILYELDSNSRQSCSQIAKKIGLSTEVVNYRIKRLEQEKIITQYQLIVNLSKLNILQFKICLSLQHINSEKLQKIIDRLNKNESLKWIVSCRGNWDLLIAIETDSIEHIKKEKDEILSLFENHIEKKSISILVEAITYNRDYLLTDKNQINKSRTIMKKEEPITIDDINLKILKILSKNARKSVLEISQELKQTPRIINYRIKQLIKNKIILGFKIAINYEKLGIKFYKTFIYLDNQSAERKKQFIHYLTQHPNIIHHVEVISNWDLEPEFEVFGEEEFDNIINDIKNNFSDIIKSIDVITISKEHKFIYF